MSIHPRVSSNSSHEIFEIDNSESDENYKLFDL